jgi:acetyltransferase-like isoleucine patch superfamily enzyme
MIKKMYGAFYYLFMYPYYRIIFKRMGGRTRVVSPLRIEGAANISLGNRVVINYKAWLAALPLTGLPTANLVIGDGTTIGNFNHIYATHEIIIGQNVLTADKIYISDNLHSYEDIKLPVIKQPIKQISTVTIGDGAWIGENVCIIGASVGKGSVIGANSVVTKNIPDYCVAVGSPARVIKRFNFEKSAWFKTDRDGQFID